VSNALAIATVTTALAQIVRTAAQSAVGGAEVLTSRPDPNATPGYRIHLFLYQVTPNGAMRNNDLPTRSSNGRLIQRPAVALDLHYLLAFYGNEIELEPQRMLGAVFRDLNAKPVLTKHMIQDAVANPILSRSNLAESVEKVKFTPLAVSLEEMSKIWSVFFQIPYALSVAYQGTMVLIESDEAARPSLPVLSRGEKDKGVDTLLGPFPSLDRAYYGMPHDLILQARPPSLPAAQLGLAVIVKGRNLNGENVFLRFRHSRRDLRNSQDQELVTELRIAPEDQSPTELKAVLPSGTGTTQTDWAPGVYTVTAVKQPPGSERESTSNALPIAIAPIIADTEVQTGTVTITCKPQIHPGQQAVLLLAGREIVGEIDVNNSDKVIFDTTKLPPVNNELIRLRVDGIESMPFIRDDSSSPPRFAFDPDQRVTIP
jgi:hypothetical protein